MAPIATTVPVKVKKSKSKWSMTVIMNARDLSRDDDFLSHLLVEHLGTEDAPLQVHKMDPSRRLPKHDPADLLTIVKKYIVRKGGASTASQRVKRAVDALLELPAVKQYLHKRSPAQINAFATHASRYLELYSPTGTIEISHTSRYSHRTGKSELCILATGPLKVGQVITDLKGSLAHLTVEEDEELRRTDTRRRDGGIRRDFSVIHSNQKNRSHLFLGPARFVNHDCDHNVELFRDGRIITFRVIKPIMPGQEVTANYGDGYFGKGNRHCLCQTCETHGRGGYTPAEDAEDTEPDIDDSSTDEETREARIRMGLGLVTKGNPNERRTRRRVYAIVAEQDTDEEDRVEIAEGSANNPSAVLAGKPGNSSIHRRLSDASTLTSLSDSGVPSLLMQDPSGPSTFSSVGPSRQPSLPIDTRDSTVTPKSSRQSSGDAQDISLDSVVTREKEMAKLAIQKMSRRSGRPPKRSLVITSVSDSRKSSVQPKSGTPVTTTPTPTPKKPLTKPQKSVPRCGTCSNGITQLVGSKFNKQAVHTCPRCRRHFAIYGSVYPNRTANLKPLSSSSSEAESDDDDANKSNNPLLDSLSKRRKIDSLSVLGRIVSDGQGSWDNPAIGEKRKWEVMNYLPEKEKIIRRICAVPSLPFAKPIPFLYARPSPVSFARSSWTSALFIDRGRDDVMSNVGGPSTRSSIQRENTSGVRSGRRSSSTKGLSPTPSSLPGLKRKRDSLQDMRPRERIGRVFYMKSGVKKMPKGWVLVTDSSSETEGEEGEVENGDYENEQKEEDSMADVKEIVEDSTLSGQIKPSQADSLTPTSVPFSDTTIAASIINDNAVIGLKPSSVVSVPLKRKKTHDAPADPGPSDNHESDNVLDGTASNSNTPRTRARMKAADSGDAPPPPSIDARQDVTEPPAALQGDVDSPPGMTNSNGSTSECSVDTLANENNVDHGDVTVVESHLNAVRTDGQVDIVTILGTVKETEVARSALKISNLIHGTAFSFGHPDARISWKPKYRYDEVLGWISESTPPA